MEPGDWPFVAARSRNAVSWAEQQPPELMVVSVYPARVPRISIPSDALLSSRDAENDAMCTSSQNDGITLPSQAASKCPSCRTKGLSYLSDYIPLMVSLPTYTLIFHSPSLTCITCPEQNPPHVLTRQVSKSDQLAFAHCAWHFLSNPRAWNHSGTQRDPVNLQSRH